ncbi:hypothetical protein D3C79_678650 [compost metagenome]
MVLQFSAIDQQLGALLHARGDVAADPVAVLGAYQRAHFALRVMPRADLQGAYTWRQAFNQTIGNRIAHGHCNRDGHAALTSRTVSRTHQRIGGFVEVGVGHYQHVVLGAAQRLHTFAVGRSSGIDVAGDRCRTDKADGLDIRVYQQGIHGHFVTVDNVEHPRWQPGLLQ